MKHSKNTCDCNVSSMDKSATCGGDQVKKKPIIDFKRCFTDKHAWQSKPAQLRQLLLPQFNTCSSSGVFDRLLVKKSFDLLRLFLNASHMGFCMFFKLSIPFCRRSFGKGRFQIPVQ